MDILRRTKRNHTVPVVVMAKGRVTAVIGGPGTPNDYAGMAAKSLRDARKKVA